jgi:hypothetical protein
MRSRGDGEAEVMTSNFSISEKLNYFFMNTTSQSACMGLQAL